MHTIGNIWVISKVFFYRQTENVTGANVNLTNTPDLVKQVRTLNYIGLFGGLFLC